MSRFTLLRKAEEDLLGIWTYIAKDNPQAATLLLRTINGKCRLLAENGKLGPARPDITPDMRYLAVGNYLILYREVSAGIEVVRVLHGARNLTGLFPND